LFFFVEADDDDKGGRKMKYAAKSVLGAALLILLLAAGCSEGDSGAGGTDGDSSNPYDMFAQACTTQSDCGEGMECIAFGASTICTAKCTSDMECNNIKVGAQCLENDGTYVCFPYELIDPDGDSDVTDGDNGGNGCEIDTFRCADDETVEKCSSDGLTWAFYKECDDGEICEDGKCGVEGTECEPETFQCRGLYEVQRCTADGSSWELYRTCDSGLICDAGECVDVMDPDGDGEDAAEEEEEVIQGDPCEQDDDCLDENHYCWINDFVNESGVCQPYCHITGVHCASGYTCDESKCIPIAGYCTSNAQCATFEFCDFRPGSSDGLCVPYCYYPGQMCPEHTYCMENSGDLNYGKCIYEGDVEYCSNDNDCGLGRWCYVSPGQIEGVCMDMCSDDDECVGSLVCKGGKCVVGVGTGDCGPAGCQAGYICDPTYNTCVLNCPPACDDGWSCNADSAPNCIEGCNPPVGNICGFGLAMCCAPHTCSVFIWAYGLVGICS